MKIIELNCPNCKGPLKIDYTNNKAYCEHCGTVVILDDEVQHFQYDNAEDAGYNFEKGRMKAQEEQRMAEMAARQQAEQQRLVQQRIEQQRILAQKQEIERSKQNQKKKTNKAAIIIPIVVGTLILLMVICCAGSCFISGVTKGVPNQTGSDLTGNDNTSLSLPTKKLVSSASELDDGFVSQLKTKADNEVNNYVVNNGKDAEDYKDILESGEYLGYCFGVDENAGNEIYYLYRINNKTQSIDRVNLRTFEDERSIFYYVGYCNIEIQDDGTLTIDDSVADTPTERVPDFTSKATYNLVMYNFSHEGYPFITELFSDLENKYPGLECNPGKDKIINSVHLETVNIINYADNIPHCSSADAGGYVDGIGEEYNECMYAYAHNAWPDPVCMDYRIGSEYSKLSFKCTFRKGWYSQNSEVFVRVIDKDTFEVIGETDTIKGKNGITAEIDVTGHRNIRLQFVEAKPSAEQILIKDIMLSE